MKRDGNQAAMKAAMMNKGSDMERSNKRHAEEHVDVACAKHRRRDELEQQHMATDAAESAGVDTIWTALEDMVNAAQACAEQLDLASLCAAAAADAGNELPQCQQQRDAMGSGEHDSGLTALDAFEGGELETLKLLTLDYLVGDDEDDFTPPDTTREAAVLVAPTTSEQTKRLQDPVTSSAGRAGRTAIHTAGVLAATPARQQSQWLQHGVAGSAESTGGDAMDTVDMLAALSTHKEAQWLEDPTVSKKNAGGEAMCTVLEALINKAREARELVYMGSTRVVIGPGFTVRELLFGDEAVSVRITAEIMDTTLAFLRSSRALGEFGTAFRKAIEVVEVVDVDAKVAAAAQGKIMTPGSITAHLSSKHALEPFCEALQVFSGRLDGFDVERVNPTLPRADWHPPGLMDVDLTGSLSISWALGPGSGSAWLTFATAGAANVFLSSFLAGQMRGFNDAKIELVGYVDDIGMSDTGRLREQQKKRCSPSLPPLKTVTFQCCREKRVQVYDEAKINVMDTSAVLALQFTARVHSGLPATMDASQLVNLLRPHNVDVVIGRCFDASAARSEKKSGHLFAPLKESLDPGEELRFVIDDASQRASATVYFASMERLDAVMATALSSSLWSTMDRPFGALPRVSALYEWRASLAEDMRAYFQTELVDVRAFANIQGVCWQEARASGGGTHKVYTLGSSCVHALQRVIARFEAVISHEPLTVSASSAAHKLPSQWKKLVQELKTKMRGCERYSGTSCVRDNLRQGVMWVYGTKDNRRDLINEIKARCLPHRSERRDLCCVCNTSKDPTYIDFSACEPTACLACIRPGVTALNPLPLRCPAAGCGRLMDVHEVIAITTNVGALVKLAVLDFVAKHADEYAVCPQPGCNQILQRVASTTGELPRTAFTACESCRSSYCLVCSDAVGSAVAAHDGFSCAEAQVAYSLNVDRHVHVIRNGILTLTCPHCKCAFVDFDDCLSVACANVTCSHQFCACCLNFSSENAKITAMHVRKCSKNVAHGDGAEADATQRLHAIHRHRRQHQLKTYLDTHVQSSDGRSLVLQRLAQDLSDLGLAMT